MYQVTITEITQGERPMRHEYKQVAATGNERDRGPVFEYVQPPDVEVVTERRTIYEQTVSVLNVVKVIEAVNTPLSTGESR